MNVHHVETYPRPHWRCFLRRDQTGRIAEYPAEARRANARLAARYDRKLRRLVALGDAGAVRRRLCHLGIWALSCQEVAELIEGAQP